MSSPFEILLYYRYTSIADPAVYVDAHRALCEELDLKGRILIAAEGINGTVSGASEATKKYREALSSDPVMTGIEFKIDEANGHAFKKLSVKLRPELVSLGLAEDIDPSEMTGQRLSPAEWKEQMESGDEDVVIIDARNDYESDLGYFEGAIRPPLDNFRDFPGWVEENRETLEGKRILTYCTGGIRCEKFSGLLLREGFEDVSQLHGGIVEYGKDPQTKGAGFQGSCYVFDERIGVGVNQTAEVSVVSSCRSCGVSSDRYVNCAHPPCNRRIFVCEPCEDSVGRFCDDSCRDAESNRVAVDIDG